MHTVGKHCYKYWITYGNLGNTQGSLETPTDLIRYVQANVY
jgi:hypothetical protein